MCSWTSAWNGDFAKKALTVLVHFDDRKGVLIIRERLPIPVYDHAGIWCVECVVEGRLKVTQYEVVEEKGDRYRFVEKEKTLARVGDAGCLIPPFEYHTLENALTDRTSITLHVYGGEMDTCNLYTPEPSGWWIKGAKQLEYDH